MKGLFAAATVVMAMIMALATQARTQVYSGQGIVFLLGNCKSIVWHSMTHCCKHSKHFT